MNNEEIEQVRAVQRQLKDNYDSDVATLQEAFPEAFEAEAAQAAAAQHQPTAGRPRDALRAVGDRDFTGFLKAKRRTLPPKAGDPQKRSWPS